MTRIVPLSFFKIQAVAHKVLYWSLKSNTFFFFFSPFPQMSSKRSSSFRRAIANGRRTLQREILLDETGLGLYKRFVRYVAYEILPCETDRRWYFHQNRLCPPPVFIAIVTIVQVIDLGGDVFDLSYNARVQIFQQHVWPALLLLAYSIILLVYILACATNPQHWLWTVLLAQSFSSDPLKRFSAFDHTLLLWARYELVTHLGVRGLVGAFNAIPPSWNLSQHACRDFFFFFRHWFWNLETRSVSTVPTTVALSDL